MSTNFENDMEFNGFIRKPSLGRGCRLAAILAVVAIIGIMIGLLLLSPLNRSAGPAARRSQCINNLKQIGMALFAYEQEYKALPPAYTADAKGRLLHSWRTLILPYLEEVTLYGTIDLSKPWNDPANAKALETSLSDFHCPGSVGPPNTTTYLADRRSEWLLDSRCVSSPGGDHRRSLSDSHGDRSR